MKPPYENNKVYAVASTRRGLKTGYVSAVYAEQHTNQWVAPDAARGGRFFLVEPGEHRDNGGNADRWDPLVPDGFLLAMSEDEDPLDLDASHILSTWSDRATAWAEFEARRSAGRKGAQTRAEREAAEEVARLAEARKAREEAPLGRLKKEARGLEHAFLIPARNGYPERLLVHLTMSPEGFTKMMERRGADPALVEEFLEAERAEDR